MSDYVTLSCPSCGGKLEITSDIDRFACAHCGTEHVVRRGGGLVSLAPVAEEIRRVRTGVDKTASELAIARLTKEIEELEKQKTQSESTGCASGFLTGALVGGGVLVVGWIAVFAAIEISEMNLLFFVPPLLAVIAFFVFQQRGAKAGEKQAQLLMQEINKKHSEIERQKRFLEAEETS